MATSESEMIVLFALDESEHSEQAFQWFMKEYHNPKHKVVIVSVVEAHHFDTVDVITLDAYPAMVPTGAAWREELSKKKQQATEFLQRLLRESQCTDMDIKMEILEGSNPGEVIVEQAQELGTAMIVMGTRGLGMIRRTILGSVSDYVIHHAHCPVLVYRPPEETL